MVSIHALLAECDLRLSRSGFPASCFNPRTPCGVRRSPPDCGCRDEMFQSTHSLRSATGIYSTDEAVVAVSIHALLAECDWICANGTCPGRCFNPRTPCGVRLEFPVFYKHIAGFNPRTPCGVRQYFGGTTSTQNGVSIHALLAECDWERLLRTRSRTVSIHALLAECDGMIPADFSMSPRFQSTHSLRSATFYGTAGWS